MELLRRVASWVREELEKEWVRTGTKMGFVWRGGEEDEGDEVENGLELGFGVEEDASLED